LANFRLLKHASRRRHLLIVAALAQKGDCLSAARSQELDIAARIRQAGAALSYRMRPDRVNNRNLKTFKVSRNGGVWEKNSVRLRVAESGIHSGTDVASCARRNYDAFLIGESLMREHPGRNTEDFAGRTK
jgi:indole-3-glycerol phosphate synthase